MNNIVFGDNSKGSDKESTLYNTQKTVSAISLLTPTKLQRVPVPAPLPANVQIAGGATVAELFAKNNQLQKELTIVTNKYNSLVNQLRAGGVIN